MSEREKMLNGLPYNAIDSELLRGRLQCRKLLRAYNVCFTVKLVIRDVACVLYIDYRRQEAPPPEYVEGQKPEESNQHTEMLAELFGISPERARLIYLEPPFYCDYGLNIKFKGEFYVRSHLTESR
jgi:maltose O-acetyltransferase